jgi:hypothetical protein
MWQSSKGLFLRTTLRIAFTHLKAEYIWEMCALYSVQNLYLPASSLNRLTLAYTKLQLQGPEDELYVHESWSHAVREEKRYSVRNQGADLNICTNEARSNKWVEKTTK